MTIYIPMDSLWVAGILGFALGSAFTLMAVKIHHEWTKPIGPYQP